VAVLGEEPDTMKRSLLQIGCLLALLSLPALAEDLSVTGQVQHELQLSQADLARMATVHVTARDHDKTHDYEGVPLQAVLDKAGTASGKKLRGLHMRDFLLARARDGYAVVFSLAEIDPGLAGEQVLVVFKQDGKPLPDGQGPVRLVVPGDKKPARWVRMLKSLTVMTVPR
jgi:DMSO/TMAO reductase YedYZ molybdopterin-dependent catalytic subunit